MKRNPVKSVSGHTLSTLTGVGGYQRRCRCLTEAFNFLGALVLLILSLPIWLVLVPIIWLREGRPIFYRGDRMGRDKQLFTMYKFRTLVKDAETQLQAQLLGSRHDLVTPTGKFLRDTRLDELPQLWNVLRRDMDLVGPRPVRPAVYDKVCRQIPNYDRRFSVRPGVIGFSQLFTPHSAPKAIRSLIDNRLLAKKEKVTWNIGTLILTAYLMTRSICKKTGQSINKRIKRRIFHQFSEEKRRYDRVRAKHPVKVFMRNSAEDNHYKYIGEMVDINVEAFLLNSQQDIRAYLPTDTKLETLVHKTGRSGTKRKRAYCRAELYRATQNDDGTWSYVLTYEPATPLNFYIFHQYFLLESVG
ncbi:MAG: sugar transferase [Verrucomicrobiota bacterium]